MATLPEEMIIGGNEGNPLGCLDDPDEKYGDFCENDVTECSVGFAFGKNA